MKKNIVTKYSPYIKFFGCILAKNLHPKEKGWMTPSIESPMFCVSNL
jgi:hypothetical protein